MDVATLTSWMWVVLSGATTVILIPLAIYFVRYYWDRRRRHVFERLIRDWASREQVLRDDLTDDDWNALAAAMLNEAGFEPAKIKDFIELGVWFAKGLASLEVRGRI